MSERVRYFPAGEYAGDRAEVDGRIFDLSEPSAVGALLETLEGDASLARDPVGEAVLDLVAARLDLAETEALLDEQQRTGRTGTEKLLAQWRKEQGWVRGEARTSTIVPDTATGNLRSIDLSTMPTKSFDEMSDDEKLAEWRRQYGR